MLLRQFLQAFRPSQVSRNCLCAGSDRGERVVDFVRDARCQLADASQAPRTRELLLHFRDAGNVVQSHYCERGAVGVVYRKNRNDVASPTIGLDFKA